MKTVNWAWLLLCFSLLGFRLEAKTGAGWLHHYPPESFIQELYGSGEGNTSQWESKAGRARLDSAYQAAVAEGDLEVQFAILVVQAAMKEPVVEFFDRFRTLRQAEELIPDLPADAPVLSPFLSLLARTYTKLNLYDKALEAARKRGVLLKKVLPGPNVTTMRNNSRIATQLKRMGHLDSAILCLKENVQLGDQIQDTLFRASTRNNLGMMYIQLGELDSAEQLFQEALEILRVGQEGDFKRYNLCTSIMDNQGIILQKQERYEEAIKVFKASMSCGDGNLAVLRTIKINFRIGWNLDRLGRRQEAIQYLERAMEILPEARLKAVKIFKDEPVPLLLALLAKLYHEEGDYIKEVEVLRKSLSREEVISEYYREGSNNALLIMMAENDQIFARELERKALEVEYQRSIVESTRLRTLTILACSIIFFLILFLFIYRRSLRLKRERELESLNNEMLAKELENRELKEDKLRSELEYKQKDLTNMALLISQRREFANEVLSQLEETRNLEERELGKALKDLVIGIRQKLNSDNTHELIHQNISQINAEFFTNLEARFPKLTKTEKILCSLLRLKLPNKEIANIRNVNPSAVKLGKTRLRKKLGLEPGADLESFLEGF